MRPRVLIVEDDHATREALQRILEREGLAVQSVADGEKAVGALETGRFEAIVLDLGLPKMSGTDVMEYIASTNPQLLASVIVVTGLELREIRKLFPEICETLAKPVQPKRLLDLVRRCLQAGEGSGKSGASVA